jgi:hypothetical protein
LRDVDTLSLFMYAAQVDRKIFQESPAAAA